MDSDSTLSKSSEVIDPLLKINTMKFMTSVDLKVATQVKFALVDLRLQKKPNHSRIDLVRSLRM